MLSILQQIFKLFFIMLTSLSISGLVMAGNEFGESNKFNIHEHWIKATDEELAQQRGGFVLPNGVNIDISLERIIVLNGIETRSSLLQLSDDNTLLLQSGTENMVPDTIGGALGTVIQNSLDDQVIKAINEINIELSNLQDANLADSHTPIHFESMLPVLQ